MAKSNEMIFGGIMDFLNRNAGAIQAISAILTVLLALAALVGVKVQIDAADRIQRAQSARDIYREFLNLSVANAKFADPQYCTIRKSGDFGAYESYVNYLLYTSEQLLSVDGEWKEVLKADLAPHVLTICDMDDAEVAGHTDEVQSLLKELRGQSCENPEPCE